MTANQSLDYERLARAAKARRLELDMSMAAVAEAAETSKGTYHRIEAGMPIRDTGYARVETVLGWAAGSCRSILEGSDPAPAEADEATVAKVAEEDLSQAVTSALVAVSDSLTAAEIREVSRRAVEELKRRGIL